MENNIQPNDKLVFVIFYTRNTGYEKEINKLNNEIKVLLTWLLDERAIRPLYRGAALFVFPSLYEGYGLPIIEAMACGTAVVCSNRTSMPEITGDAAYLFDPEIVEDISAALKEVISNSKLRDNLVQKGLKKVNEINKKLVFKAWVIKD